MSAVAAGDLATPYPLQQPGYPSRWGVSCWQNIHWLHTMHVQHIYLIGHQFYTDYHRIDTDGQRIIILRYGGEQWDGC